MKQDVLIKLGTILLPISFLTLGILFGSHWFHNPYALFSSPTLRGELALLAALFFPLLVLWKKPPLGLITISGLVLICWGFFSTSAGRLIFSDDHPTFLYRLTLLQENFPSIPFYNPLWNGGLDQRDFFATGALNLYLLLSPLLTLFKVVDVYNGLVMLLLLGIIPTIIFYASSFFQLERTGRWIAVILALSSSILWYRWFMQYGTLGFITTTALVPLVLGLASKIMSRDEITFFEAALTVIATTLMLFWSPSGIVFLPVICYSLFRISFLLQKRYSLFIITALILVNVPWVLLFWNVSNVSSFLQAEEKKGSETHEIVTKKKEVKAFKHKSGGIDLPKSFSHMKEIATSSHPLTLLFFLPGILFFPRPARLLALITFGWLLILGALLPPVKPQLELDRMLVIFAFAASIPAARALQHIFEERTEQPTFLPPLLRAITLAFLVVGLINVSSITKGRSIIPVAFSDSLLPEMTKAIKEHHGGGRVLFSGFVLHDLSGGHLAPLAAFTKIPLVASSHVHNLWQYKQVFPEQYIERGDEGIQEYLNLYNVTSVFAHETRWKKYFAARNESYQLVWQHKKFQLFRRVEPKQSYFLEGGGEVLKQTNNSVTFSLDTPEAVIAFNYFPFLTSKECTVTPHRIDQTITFVRLSSCKQKQSITISSIPPWQRLVQS